MGVGLELNERAWLCVPRLEGSIGAMKTRRKGCLVSATLQQGVGLGVVFSLS